MLKQDGLQGPAEEEDHAMNRSYTTHRCLPCAKSFASRRAWGSHSFKVHGRINPCRSLQSGTICEACGKRYPSHERLVCHLRTSSVCQSTMAAQRLWVQPQPYYGNRIVQREPVDSMIPWAQTDLPLRPARNAQAMTAASYQALRWTSIIDWKQATAEQINDFVQQLCTVPVHWEEFLHILNAQKDPHALTCLDRLCEQMRALYFPEDNISVPKDDKCMWHEHLEELHFQPRLPRPRGHPKMLYVLHLFSGVKRQDDIHSAIAGMAAREHGILCPISIDIVFDSQTGGSNILVGASTERLALHGHCWTSLWNLECEPTTFPFGAEGTEAHSWRQSRLLALADADSSASRTEADPGRELTTSICSMSGSLSSHCGQLRRHWTSTGEFHTLRSTTTEYLETGMRSFIVAASASCYIRPTSGTLRRFEPETHYLLGGMSLLAPTHGAFYPWYRTHPNFSAQSSRHGASCERCGVSHDATQALSPCALSIDLSSCLRFGSLRSSGSWWWRSSVAGRSQARSPPPDDHRRG